VDRILVEHAVERAEYPFDEIQLRQMIAAARRHGYAYNDIHVFKGMETITDMAAVSVPIRSSSGTPVAALHLTAITQRLAQPRRDNIVAALRHELEAIEQAYRPVLDAMQPQAKRQQCVTCVCESDHSASQGSHSDRPASQALKRAAH
jgi:hypothetical protein